MISQNRPDLLLGAVLMIDSLSPGLRMNTVGSRPARLGFLSLQFLLKTAFHPPRILSSFTEERLIILGISKSTA